MLLKNAKKKADEEFKKAITAAKININKKKNTLKKREFKLIKIKESVNVIPN
jgi:hypothetical protein